MAAKRISIENQWQEYLKRVGIPDAKMSPIQRQETKRAFFGACGQMLVITRDEVGAIENEEEAIQCLEDMFQQVAKFWMNEKNLNN